MKAILAIFLLVISTTTLAENTRINDENIPFLYESRADIPSPDHKIAALISSEYKNAGDEFTRHDLFKKILPVLKKRMKEAKATNKVTLIIGGKLGEYDFDKGAFSTGFGERTYMTFKHGYGVSFTNGSKIKFLPVDMAQARGLAGHLRDGRDATFIVNATVVESKEESLGWGVNKVLKVKVDTIEVSLKSGAEVGSKTL